MAKIESIAVATARIPLDNATSFATRTVSARDSGLVRVRAAGVRKRRLLSRGQDAEKARRGNGGLRKSRLSCREDEGGTALPQGGGGARKSRARLDWAGCRADAGREQRLARFAYRDAIYGAFRALRPLLDRGTVLPR